MGMAGQPELNREIERGDGSDEELNRAIDGLRGVLRKDTDGVTSAEDLESVSEMTNAATGPSKAFPADFGSDFDDGPSPFDASPAGASLDGMFGAEAPLFDDEPTAALFAPEPEKPARRTSDSHRAKTGSAINNVAETGNYDLVMDIPIDMQIVLGTSRLPVASLMNLSEGSLIALDRQIGEPVDILVNGRHFGRGEITVLDGDDNRFGIRLIEVMTEKSK
jgi:flagellar motor switch protein FliN